MAHDLFLFAWLVVSGWLAWIGLVSTVLWVVAQIADRPDWGFLKPKRLWSTLAVFFIVAAMFQVWRDQYHEAQRLQSSAAQQRAPRRLITAQKHGPSLTEPTSLYASLES
jgi:hypothetical protein